MTDWTEAGLERERLAKMAEEQARGWAKSAEEPWDDLSPTASERDCYRKTAADWRTIASIIRESPDRAAVVEGGPEAPEKWEAYWWPQVETCVMAMTDLPRADLRERIDAAVTIASQARELVEKLGEQWNATPTPSAPPIAAPRLEEEAEKAWWAVIDMTGTPGTIGLIRAAVRAEIRAASSISGGGVE